jgi:hypothetical protein
MYLHEQLDVRSALADSGVVPPYYTLVAFPEYVTAGQATELFSVPGMLWELFHGSRRAHTLFQPRVWAPGWSDQELVTYLTSPFPEYPWPFPDRRPAELRVGSFLEPAEGYSAKWFKPPCYDMVLVVSRIESSQAGRLRLDDSVRRWNAEDLSKKLGECRTRLLVLVCLQPGEWERACDFGRQIGQSGGPAVLVVAGEPKPVRDYLVKFHEDISHNRPLSEAASVPAWLESAALNVLLAIGREGDDLLRLDLWTKALDAEFGYWERELARQQEDWHAFQERLLAELRPLLHPAQMENLAALDAAEGIRARGVSEALREERRRIENLPSQPWHHESEGSLIVSGATQAMQDMRPRLIELSEQATWLLQESLGATAGAELKSQSAWVDGLMQEIRSAPRVLNAGFKPRKADKAVSPTEALIGGDEYELLVDVGPRWDKLESLVTGSAEFPERALPPSEAGHLLDVVFLSEDFSPPLVSGRIFLPYNSGRSGVWKGEGQRVEAGPVALTVRVRGFPEQDKRTLRTAHGRLGVYFENNLLQSARVRVTVGRERSAAAAEPNVIEVDYVLSGSFQDVGGRFAKRNVRFDADDTWKDTDGKGHPVALNITLNDDGSGSHRILIMSQETEHVDLPEMSAWMSYDPEGAKDLLRIARRDLLGCFFVKDQNTGDLPEEAPQDGLDGQNGQKKEQFQWDLIRLAHRGHKLIESVFSKLYPDEQDATLAAQARRLRKGLLHSRVIQIARTGTASYTLPWALFYDIPLSQDREQNRFCKCVDEDWGADGRRVKSRTTCRYAADTSHERNTYCPFAFWGLKHVLEQPLSPRQPGMKEESWRKLLNASKAFGKPGIIPMGLCVTNALQVTDLARRNAHLESVAKLKGYQVRLPGAEGLDAAAEEVLKSAVVYVLCHGELDGDEKEPYLGIGARDKDPQHRIYPTTVNGWASDERSKQWEEQRPLVFINGCHTFDLEPGQMLDFVTSFGYLGASGLLGTEVSVRLPLAIEVAESFLTLIAEGTPVGESLQRVRWSLANKGNLLGLAYTPYCVADLSHSI